MEALKYIAVCLFAYLCGSFNTSIFISKHLYGIDVRNYGSGNAGATNTLRTLGVKKAFVVLLGDIVKVVVPVLAARWAEIVYPELIAGSFAVIGHSKPIYYGFKGGKGVACAVALIGLFDWRILLCLVPVFFGVFFLTKIISLATFSSIIALWILVLVFHGGETVPMIYFAVLGIYIFYLHKENIKRLLKGTENRIDLKAKLLKDTEKKK